MDCLWYTQVPGPKGATGVATSLIGLTPLSHVLMVTYRTGTFGLTPVLVKHSGITTVSGLTSALLMELKVILVPIRYRISYNLLNVKVTDHYNVVISGLVHALVRSSSGMTVWVTFGARWTLDGKDGATCPHW